LYSLICLIVIFPFIKWNVLCISRLVTRIKESTVNASMERDTLFVMISFQKRKQETQTYKKRNLYVVVCFSLIRSESEEKVCHL